MVINFNIHNPTIYIQIRDVHTDKPASPVKPKITIIEHDIKTISRGIDRS